MKNVLFPRFSDETLWLKIAIGVVLMFVPGVNLLAFGYLYRFVRSPKFATDGGINLPPWDDWQQLFIDGVRLALFILAHVVVAIFLSFFTNRFFYFGSMGYLDIHLTRIFPFFMVVLQPLFLVALMLYQKQERLRDLLDVCAIAHYLHYVWWPMLWPALGFWGLQVVCGVPYGIVCLYGIAWFAGFGILFASFNELLRHYGDRMEDPKVSDKMGAETLLQG
jgi:hypothetical protein